MQQLQKDRNYTNYLIRLIENKARTSTTKDELIKYINETNKLISNPNTLEEIRKNNYLFDINIYNSYIKKILNDYDKSHEPQINSSEYQQMNVNGNNYIISKDGKVLEQSNNKNMGQLAQDFKNKQNEMIGAKTNDSIVNANEAFNIMQKEMEESNFMSLDKVDKNKISQELNQKIELMKNNPNINSSEFQVDIKRGIFINTKNKELYEMQFDPQTNQYKLYKGQQATYTDNNALNNQNNNNTNSFSYDKNKLSTDDLAMFSDEELKNMENNNAISEEKKQTIMKEIKRRKEEAIKEKEKEKTNTNIKKRVLKLDKIKRTFEGGYISTILIVIISAISGVLIATLLLSTK